MSRSSTAVHTHGSAALVALVMLSDADLVAACRGGTAEAWAQLVERFSRYVYAITTRIYRLPDADAEDVFQEVFARTYEHLDGLRDDDAIRPWIGQLTRRLCVDRLRARRNEDLGSPVGMAPGDVDAALHRLDDALDVRAALATLSPDCQEIVDRFFARDESYQTIAAAMGIPMGTVASRLSRCLTKLRLELEPRA